MTVTPLQRLSEYGQSPWLDGFGRRDELDRLRREHGIRGATSDVAALVPAIERGAYDDEIRALRQAVVEPRELLARLRAADARDACDVLRPVWEQTGGHDGHVSLALDPGAKPLRAQTDRLLRLVARRNLMLAIPATDAGLGAIEEAVAAGISVHAALICSPPHIDAVAEAYMRGIARLIANGGDPRHVAAVVGLSLSPVDAEVDRRLAAAGADAYGHRGRLGIASARLAHRRIASLFADRRWQALAVAGATRMRCLWTATSTSGSGYRDVLYAEQLIGAGTVVALTRETLSAFEDHGVVADTLARCARDAARVVREVSAAGVDLGDVAQALESEGMRRLEADFDRAVASVARRIPTPDPPRP